MNTTTDTRPLADRITQGPVEVHPHMKCRVVLKNRRYFIAETEPPGTMGRGLPYKNPKDNAELIADAFNTAHRTRRTPSELASERQELLDMLTTLLDRAETVAEGIPVDKRHAGVSPATHVAHMASHLAQHCKPARELTDRLTKTTNPTEQ